MTDIIQELRELIAREKDARHCLSLPGDPAWPIEQDRKKSAQTALQNAAVHHLPGLLDRLEAAERGWQPIETAPHMREVLLWADTSVPPFDNWRMASGYFHSEINVWVWGGEQVREWAFPPTHWRPLPDAPAIREVKP